MGIKVGVEMSTKVSTKMSSEFARVVAIDGPSGSGKSTVAKR